MEGTGLEVLYFNPVGNLFASLFFAIVPLLALFALLFHRGEKTRRRFYYVSLCVPLVAFYAVFYWFFFYDQYYKIVFKENGFWQLEYKLPTRVTVIDATEIEAMELITRDARTFRTARVVLRMRDGREFSSAQLSPDKANAVLMTVQLQKLLSVGDG